MQCYYAIHRHDLYMDDPENTIVIGNTILQHVNSNIMIRSYENILYLLIYLGLSWVSGMCHHLFSCSVNEGTTFESVYVISHELGHK